MQRNPPTFTYNGLTIILSNPSRFDKYNLISAGGGRIFDEFIRPEYNRCQCDIRIKEDTSPLLPGTKCILVLGSDAAFLWTKDNNPIGAIRGSIYWYDGSMTKQDCRIPLICSFFPQDAADIKNYEKEFNKKFLTEDEEESESEYDNTDDKRRHGKTKRKNYRFWLGKDIEKCKSILKNGVPKRPFEPNFILYPKSEEVIKTLRTTKNQEFFFDIESFWPDAYFKCISFSFEYGNPIYCIPIYLPNNTWAYSNLCDIICALAIALRDNVNIAYNGQCFDFPLLVWKLGIPFGKRLYDPMIAHHRCFSSIEKSLGHSTSLWTYEPFHKDEGDVGYKTFEQAKQTWEYCCKDVYTMQLIKYAIDEYCKTKPGLKESIDSANNSIRAYVTCMLQGFTYKQQMLESIINENDRLMMHYLDFLNILIGKDTLKEIAGKSKKGLPGSNKQCCEYFHNRLGYPIVDYGKETQKGLKNPSLGRKQLLKLRLQHDNPVIDIVMVYRELARESGSLKFIPWKE